MSKDFQSWGNWSSRVRLLSSVDGANVGWDGLEVGERSGGRRVAGAGIPANGRSANDRTPTLTKYC